jgi:predicted nucleotidyltransferase
MPATQTKIDFDSIEHRPLELSDHVIKKVCDRIVTNFHPQKIILFGSQSKGTATSNSDLDLLVIIDNENILAPLKRRDRYAQILRLFRHKGFGLDIIVLTNEEIEKVIAENEGEWDLILEIITEGKKLYERKTEIKQTYSPEN